MTQDELKQQVAKAAIAFIPDQAIVGVGTGSTVNFFIDELATIKHRIRAAVSSSIRSTERLQAHGITVLDANEVDGMPVYVDGADEIDGQGNMIKGGGAALTREKIVADLAERFICIADASKKVEVLGRFPLPVEVIPMAAEQIVRRFAAKGGQAELRAGVELALEATDVVRDASAWDGFVDVTITAKDGDRVVWIGSAVAEREQKYGYWETALLMQWPDRMDLWEQFEGLLLGAETPQEGEAAAMAMYREQQAEMDKGAVVSWPALRPEERARLKEAIAGKLRELTRARRDEYAVAEALAEVLCCTG